MFMCPSLLSVSSMSKTVMRVGVTPAPDRRRGSYHESAGSIHRVIEPTIEAHQEAGVTHQGKA